MIWYWECNGIFVANCKYETPALQWENGINHLPKPATLLEPQSLVGVGRHDDYGSHIVHLVFKIPLSLGSVPGTCQNSKFVECWVAQGGCPVPCWRFPELEAMCCSSIEDGTFIVTDYTSYCHLGIHVLVLAQHLAPPLRGPRFSPR